jgi:hypothetical protein
MIPKHINLSEVLKAIEYLAGFELFHFARIGKTKFDYDFDPRHYRDFVDWLKKEVSNRSSDA